jgi:hypothetical protein
MKPFEKPEAGPKKFKRGALYAAEDDWRGRRGGALGGALGGILGGTAGASTIGAERGR